MKILVLGHRGTLGSDLMLRMGGAHDITGKDIDDFDISVEEECRRVIEDSSPDVVINAAACTNVDGCETDHDRCFAVNAVGVKNVTLACGREGIRIVQFSTDCIFDGRKPSPYIEEDEPAPLNVYGASKLEGERFLQAFSDRWLLIRTSWLYGRNGGNFMKTLLTEADQAKSIDVADDQVGCPTYSWDLAGAVQLLIERGDQGIFHLTNRGRCRRHEFACKVLQYAGKTDVAVRAVPLEELCRPAVVPARSVLSCRKFFETTGRTMRFWQIALQDCLARPGGRK